jgi:hypothetical protein
MPLSGFGNFLLPPFKGETTEGLGATTGRESSLQAYGNANRHVQRLQVGCIEITEMNERLQ